MCPRARLGKVRSAMFAVVASMALPTFAVADCYDLLGCSDKNDIAKHFGYLASIKSGPNCEFLWTMRNSIFAEHNYCFQTARARSAFGNENCHYNNLADVPLNRIERANVATIARAEKFKACQR
jgi:hypothetical protein